MQDKLIVAANSRARALLKSVFVSLHKDYSLAARALMVGKNK